MTVFKTVRGMRDFLPEDARTLRYIETTARRVAESYGYKEIITPVVEARELLSAKAGEEVKSRMFVFKDLGGREVGLRPEFTASVARLVATTLRNEPRPFRLFCVGSIYRYDEPQKGRYREFWQSNYELMGSNRPEADAEILMLTASLLRESGLKNFSFKVGHVGVLRGLMGQEKIDERAQNAVMQLMDKKQYGAALEKVAEAGASKECQSILQKLVKLRGSEIFEITSKITEYVKDSARAFEASGNLEEILELVSKSGRKIDMTVDAGFARGLEYYTGMIFEIYAPDMDIAIGGGGRYDKLIELFGGESTPAVGVAHGIDRIMLAVEMQKTKSLPTTENTVLIIPIKDELRTEALKIAETLRTGGISVEVEVMGRKVTKALEDADRKKMGFAVIVGERELKEGAVVVRDLVKRKQDIVKIARVADIIRGKLSPNA